MEPELIIWAVSADPPLDLAAIPTGDIEKNPYVKLFATQALTLRKRQPMEYLIWSNKHKGWWGPNRSGYFTDLSLAGTYTEMAAMTICGLRPGQHRDYLEDGRPVSVMIEAPDMRIIRQARALEFILVLAVHGKNALEAAATKPAPACAGPGSGDCASFTAKCLLDGCQKTSQP